MNKKFIQNKKANIPITLLVIGVFAVCVLAIGSFLASKFLVDNSYYGIESMEKVDSSMEKFHFYQNLGVDESEINKSLEMMKNEDGKKYFYAEEKTLVSPIEAKVMFSVKYFLPNE